MRLPNQRTLALPKRFDEPGIWRTLGLLSLSVVFFAFAGCAGGQSGTTGITNWFRGGSPTPDPIASVAIAPTPTPAGAASPVAAETTKHPSKKTAKQARAASANAAAASKEAADASSAAAMASKQAATASKQAASVANQIDGSGPTNSDVSLESNPGAAAMETPRGAVRMLATPSSAASSAAAGATVASLARTTPVVSSPALESLGPPADGDPAKAARLIADIDKAEKRVDRKNLSADDSQRDILAQKLLQKAKKALADHDTGAATSLATKASTLLAPLPKLADSAMP